MSTTHNVDLAELRQWAIETALTFNEDPFKCPIEKAAEFVPNLIHCADALEQYVMYGYKKEEKPTTFTLKLDASDLKKAYEDALK